MSDKTRHAGFDILRAIAALSVLAVHIAPRHVGPPDTAIQGALLQLRGGVSIFFVLSGYLLYRPFIRATVDGHPAPDRRRFYKNRARRIIPAYWAALTVFALAGLLQGSPGWGMLLADYAFLQTWVPDRQDVGIPPAWTLGSEVLFYLLLPVVAALLARRRGRVSSLILRDIALATAAFWALRVLVFDIVGRYHAVIGSVDIRPVISQVDITFIATVDMFLVGMALAVIAADPDLSARARRIVPTRRVGWPAALVLYLGVALAGSWYDLTQWSIVNRVWMMTIAVLLIAPLVLRPADAPIGRVAQVFAFLGLVSYGIYIWHYPVVRYLADDGDMPEGVRIVVSVAAALALGIASFYLIERRFMASRGSQQPPLDAQPRPAEPVAVRG